MVDKSKLMASKFYAQLEVIYNMTEPTAQVCFYISVCNMKYHLCERWLHLDKLT